MIFLTHLLFAIAAVQYLGRFFGIPTSGLEGVAAIAIAAAFSSLPDADLVKSKSGKLLQPFSLMFSFLFRHRGFLHGLIFAAVVYFTVRYLAGEWSAAAAALGFLSHLALDALTKEGIMPFSPLLKWKIRGPLKTGGLMEKLILTAIAALILLKVA